MSDSKTIRLSKCFGVNVKRIREIERMVLTKMRAISPNEKAKLARGLLVSFQPFIGEKYESHG